ncbi:NADP-dependent isocitrate dehydrogenase [Desulfosediminicola flagellatus]|uniref:NADP-dependent isocitrate dehydrogenase n=1 Tax=Desulfosediminicola flagellatus TaxID=2569541 RepID=UPI00142EAC93|nr:NADP-dependent isocitrate dehydrogenase [Desulfosediminicola flagellatus]
MTTSQDTNTELKQRLTTIAKQLAEKELSSKNLQLLRAILWISEVITFRIKRW